MTIRDALRVPGRLGWLLIALAIIGCALWLWWLVIGGPARDRQVAARARADQIIAQSRVKGAGDAIVVLDGHSQTKDDRDEQLEISQDAIRNAPPADRDAATVRELCKSKAARRRPECLQPANP